MKMTEFKIRAPRGTYFGAKLSKDTCESILDFMSDQKIPNPLEQKLLHITVIYSRVFCSEKALGDLDPHWKGEFETYNVWPTQAEEDQEPTQCLTLGFICPQLHERHHDLKAAGATHDFPDFKPHMTLSYDVGDDYDHIALPHYTGPILFHHEYSEPLNLNFVNTKVNK